MRTSGLLLARARSSAGLLLTIVALAAAMTGIIAGTLGYSDAAATQTARTSLTTGAPREAAVLAQTRLADDPAAQTAAAESAIREVFGTAPVLVQRTVRGEPIDVLPASGPPEPDAAPRVVADAGAGYDPDTLDTLDVVSGSWPEADGQGALQADAAARLGVEAGDTLTLTRGGETTDIVITALWRPVDATDPRWFDDPLVAQGSPEPDAAEVGPLVLSEADVVALGGRPFVRFTVLPDATGVGPADLPVLAAGAADLRSSLQDAPGVNTSGIVVEGDLAPTTARAALNLQTAAALNLIPLTLLLAVSVIALVQIARLLAQTRARETEVMVARGAAVPQFARWGLVESAVVTAVGAVLGTGAALLVVDLFPAGGDSSGRILLAGALVLLVVLVTLVTVAALRARAIVLLTQSDRSGRLRTAAATGTVLLTFGAAAFTLWQLRRYGSPLVPSTDGSPPRGDLLAGAAPTMLLLAGAVLAMVLLGPVTRLVEGGLRRTTRVTLPLAAGQVSRRLSVYVVPVVLTVLAVGATTLAGTYAGTSAQLREQQSQLAVGTDVRVVDARPGGEVAELAAGLPGVDGVAEVGLADVALSGGRVPVLVAPADAIAGAVAEPAGSAGADLRSALAAPPAPDLLRIPDDAERIEIELRASLATDAGTLAALERFVDADASEAEREAAGDELGPPWSDPSVVAPGRWWEIWDGVDSVDVRLGVVGQGLTPAASAVTASLPAQVPTAEPSFDAAGEDFSGTLTLDLPAVRGRVLTSVGIDLALAGLPYDATVQVDRIQVDGPGGTEVLLAPDSPAWEAADAIPGAEVLAPLGVRSVVVPDVEGLREVSTVELLPPGSGDRPPVPVAVTRTVADAQDLATGSQIALGVFGGTAPAEVVAVVDALPGSTDPAGVLVGREALDQVQAQVGAAPVAPTETWIDTDDPGAVADALRDADVGAVTALDQVETTDVASAVRAVFWVASIGATLLAAAGIGAVGLTLLRERRSEVAVLRALGMPPRQQAWSRGAEIAGVATASAALGALAGWATSVVTMPTLAASTDTSRQARIQVPVRVEWPLTLLLLGLLVGTLVVVTSVVAARVRRQALDREYREEVR